MPDQTTTTERRFWIAAAALLAALRVPRLVSPNYVLDGDETIVGLMARHLARGEPTPLFFQGQSYGLSLLEVVPSAGAFLVFGSKPVVLALTMLVLFLAGLVAWERALRNLVGSPAWSRSLALAMGMLPVWVVWSMKARGGYVTAFLVAGVLIALLTDPRAAGEGYSERRALAAGGLTGVLFHAQSLWLPPVLPFLALPALRGAPWRRVGLSALAAVATGMLLVAAGGRPEGTWEPAVLLGFSGWHALVLPERLYRLFTGFFLLGDVFPAPPAVAGVAAGATVAFLGTTLVLFTAAARERAVLPAVAGLALLWSVAPIVFLNQAPPRYLLQAAAFLFVGLAVLVGTRTPGLRPARVVTAAVFLLLATSAVSTGHLRTHAVGTGSDVEEELRGLVRALEANRVEGGYAIHGLLQWQILFYGDERVPVRSRAADDRWDAYGERVDSVFRAGGRVVLVDPIELAGSPLMIPLRPLLVPVGSDYYVLPSPPPEVLEHLRFELPDRGVSSTLADAPAEAG